ncbi:MAG: (d)CMP kinase [Oscillospiraceae bacterium]
MISVAIDGPSGAGKSSLAKRLAKKLSYIYVDTGAMYRTIGLYGLQKGVDLSSERQVSALLPDINLELKYIDGEQRMFLNGEDVSTLIRTEPVSMAASAVSAHPCVRQFLLETQRKLAQVSNVLMDGRDIGTVILPNATVKIFLTASPEARAQRRFKELIEKGQEVKYEAVLDDINRRDYNDMNRDIAPLRRAEDALLVDTSDLDFEQSFTALYNCITAKIG